MKTKEKKEKLKNESKEKFVPLEIEKKKKIIKTMRETKINYCEKHNCIYSRTCPHCLREKKFKERLKRS